MGQPEFEAVASGFENCSGNTDQLDVLQQAREFEKLSAEDRNNRLWVARILCDNNSSNAEEYAEQYPEYRKQCLEIDEAEFVELFRLAKQVWKKNGRQTKHQKRQRAKEYKERNPAKQKMYKKLYRAKHKEKLNKQARERYRKKNPQKNKKIVGEQKRIERVNKWEAKEAKRLAKLQKMKEKMKEKKQAKETTCDTRSDSEHDNRSNGK